MNVILFLDRCGFYSFIEPCERAQRCRDTERTVPMLSLRQIITFVGAQWSGLLQGAQGRPLTAFRGDILKVLTLLTRHCDTGFKRSKCRHARPDAVAPPPPPPGVRRRHAEMLKNKIKKRGSGHPPPELRQLSAVVERTKRVQLPRARAG